ncbi:MAG: type IV pilus biogenesis protein PilM [Vicinamibacterales bacterium]
MSGLSDWFSLRNAPVPATALELASNRVGAATVDARAGRPSVTAHAVELLAEGVLVPSLTQPNVKDPDTLLAAVKRVLEAAGRPRRIVLILPDAVAKVSLVRFEKTPASASDLDQLVRWQVRKAAPFPIDEAQVSYVRGARHADGQEFIVTLARRDVVREYEALCEAAGAHAGIVDIATFNVANAVLAGSGGTGGDWLLVNVAPDSASIAILRGHDLLFFRSRGADAEGSLADLVHQTAMYYQDRLAGAGFERVLLCGAAAAGGRQAIDVEHIRRSLEQRLDTQVQTVDPRTAVALTDRISASQAMLDTLAPLVGAVLRGREVAV